MSAPARKNYLCPARKNYLFKAGLRVRKTVTVGALALESIFFYKLSSQDLTYQYCSCFSVTWSEALSQKSAGTRNGTWHVQPSCWSSLQSPAPQGCHLWEAAGTKGSQGRERKQNTCFLGYLCVGYTSALGRAGQWQPDPKEPAKGSSRSPHPGCR